MNELKEEHNDAGEVGILKALLAAQFLFNCACGQSSSTHTPLYLISSFLSYST